jgi:hypothetical protein
MSGGFSRSFPVPVMIASLFLFLSAGCWGYGPPERPRNVEATPLSQYDILITWTCEDEEHWDWWNMMWSATVSYYVYREGKKIAHVGGLEYEDGNLTPDTTYCYHVTSYWVDLDYGLFGVEESDRSREACARTYPLNTISGTVTSGSIGLEGVQVELTRETGFPVVLEVKSTSPEGGYTFTGLQNFSYLVVPSLPGYAFSPDQYQFSLVNQDAYGIDFSAFAEP